MTSHTIHHHALAALGARTWGDNPRRHDLESISQSLERFGYVQTLVIDDTSGMIVAGHGVLASLILTQREGLPPPERVLTPPGEDWRIPVVHVTLPEGEAKPYSLADTRTRELGGWNDAMLLRALQELSENDHGLDGTGFTPDDVSVLIAKASAEMPASFLEIPEAGEGRPRTPVTCPHCGHQFTP